MVLIGVCIHLRSNSMETSPLCFECFGRTIQVNDHKGPRWDNLRLIREESIQIEKKFSIFVAQSLEANRVTVIDNVQDSGKNKEEFSSSEELNSGATSTAIFTLHPSSPSDSREWFKEFFVSECHWQKHVDHLSVFLLSKNSLSFFSDLSRSESLLISLVQ